MADATGVPLLSCRLLAAPTSAGHIRREVCAFAAAQGARGVLLDDIALAVTEAAANVIKHAYPGGDRGVIDVAADVEDGVLEVVVCDEGVGFHDRPSAGLGAGLRLIAACSAEFGIEGRRPQGVEVWMRFLLPRR